MPSSSSNSCFIGLSPKDARHITFRAKAVVRGSGIAIPIPFRIAQRFNWSEDSTDFLIEVTGDGTLLLKAEARPKPWAITTGE